jgi:hypothetical protein
MTAAAAVAAHNLRVDHMTADVLRAFDEEGVESVLLKGPSTVRWLYTDQPRRYQDCDLLVPPAAFGAAERVLRGLGFTPAVEQERMPDWWREHSIEWSGPERFTAVDLHRTLKGVGVEDARLWESLSADTETMMVGDFPSTVLSVRARCLLLALESSGDGVYKDDLVRAIERAGESTWREAATLARDLDALAAFAAGLWLAPKGHALAAALALPRARSVDLDLRAGRAPAEALTIERLTRASGPRERIAIACRKLVPPPTFMRHWSPTARRGRAGLVAAYGQRLVWIVRKAPRAVRAWRHARRAAQGEPPPTA